MGGLRVCSPTAVSGTGLDESRLAGVWCCDTPAGTPGTPLSIRQAKDRRRAGIYEAPCYRVKARRGNNFITTFSLRTEDDKAKWTLRGVALLCSVD